MVCNSETTSPTTCAAAEAAATLAILLRSGGAPGPGTSSTIFVVLGSASGSGPDVAAISLLVLPAPRHDRTGRTAGPPGTFSPPAPQPLAVIKQCPARHSPSTWEEQFVRDMLDHKTSTRWNADVS
jgi:hypothetical protein